MMSMMRHTCCQGTWFMLPRALKPIFPYLLISKMSLFIMLSFKGEGLDFLIN